MAQIQVKFFGLKLHPREPSVCRLVFWLRGRTGDLPPELKPVKQGKNVEVEILDDQPAALFALANVVGWEPLGEDQVLRFGGSIEATVERWRWFRYFVPIAEGGCAGVLDDPALCASVQVFQGEPQFPMGPVEEADLEPDPDPDPEPEPEPPPRAALPAPAGSEPEAPAPPKKALVKKPPKAAAPKARRAAPKARGSSYRDPEVGELLKVTKRHQKPSPWGQVTYYVEVHPAGQYLLKKAEGREDLKPDTLYPNQAALFEDILGKGNKQRMTVQRFFALKKETP